MQLLTTLTPAQKITHSLTVCPKMNKDQQAMGPRAINELSPKQWLLYKRKHNFHCLQTCFLADLWQKGAEPQCHNGINQLLL